MLENVVVDVLNKNNLKLQVGNDFIKFKVPPAGFLVKITREVNSDILLYSCNQGFILLTSMIIFSCALSMLCSGLPNASVGFLAGAMFFLSAINIFNLALLHIYMLNISAQLRKHAIYIKPSL
ncbi:hypothetical protein [Aeromonas salmonicida]|uniref:hypothetical protein n=1 Tax=Aeromonas salmonicida TaxID=645 RepID=UPI00104169CC|nr:hypothetical protein [Aeromonas salmonicida]